MKQIVFFLEERSAKEFLEAVTKKIIPPGVCVRFVIFNGKSDLENNIVRKLKRWQFPNTRFVILRDKDAGDCFQIKENLKELCAQAGKKNVLIRIACHELESFYLGDLEAVERGLQVKGLKQKQNKRKFRNPDHLSSPSKELVNLTDRKYQKIAGSRQIAPYMDLRNNNSPSFNILIDGIKRIIAESTTQ